MPATTQFQPSLDTIRDLLPAALSGPTPPNLVPVCTTISAEFLTPAAIYLKVSSKSNSRHSFLLESAGVTGTIARYSFIGVGPRKVLKSGPGFGIEADPLPQLEAELSKWRVASIPGLMLPRLTGGAIGYVGYDCVQYFEPKTKRPLKDVLKVPESLFMIFNSIIAVDHYFQVVKVITYLEIPSDMANLEAEYARAQEELNEVVAIIQSPEIPLPHQGPVTPRGGEYESNIGQEGYEAHVNRLKTHINKGDIIQAVPSQRLSRPTDLHPFNIYRHLRTINPSPYLFYIDCEDFHIVGASPELLVKYEDDRVYTHPIAGTVHRGKTTEEDEELANQLLSSIKDRAEHVMLVDLARNDLNRVCDPLTTRVDKLMTVQKFSHVQHLVSEVSGVLRPDKTRFDAFRSVFPAGTTSGAPKVRAMELIAELEGEKRGVYAGAVGYFGYNVIRTTTTTTEPATAPQGERSAGGEVEPSNTQVTKQEVIQGGMDTCIALRTMVIKDGVAYLQAGGGIVYDSDPHDEYVETLNKLGASMACIAQAERVFNESSE